MNSKESEKNPLVINPSLVEGMLVRFLREEVKKAGFERAVIGLSGGVDSSTVAYLSAKALGPSNVWALAMPYRESHPDSLKDAELVAKELEIHFIKVEITPMVDAYFNLFPNLSNVRRGNKLARERMAVLYDHSYELKGLVIGTSNKTELLLGYGTQFGDMASAINPLGDLYKTQIWQLAEYLKVPDKIVKKAPSGDLWVGQTDETELGFTYREVDQLLYYLVDERYSLEELAEAGFNPDFVRKVFTRMRDSQYKRRLPLIAKISQRTIDRDFRYARDWGK
jgi:NAD+ synthase